MLTKILLPRSENFDHTCIYIILVLQLQLEPPQTLYLFVTLSVCVSVCPEEWYKKQNNGIYYKKRAEREASPLRSSTKNRIMGYTIYYYIKRERREKHIYHFAQSMQNVAQRRDERGTKLLIRATRDESEERSDEAKQSYRTFTRSPIYINIKHHKRERFYDHIYGIPICICWQYI